MDARFRVAGIGRLPFELVAKLAGLAEAKFSSSPRSLVQSVNAGKGGVECFRLTLVFATPYSVGKIIKTKESMAIFCGGSAK